MPGPARRKGVSGTDAPFAFPGHLLWCALLYFATAHGAGAALCPAGHSGERVHVVYVTDGDTVKLSDGRRLRLIGIDTPEISHDGGASQPLADRARSVLTDLLSRYNNTLNLQYGQEARDHYGRLLAHAFLDDGSNVGARLLEQGLATTLVVPPNTWGLDCYRAAEQHARSARRGLWALPGYQAMDAATLPRDSRGFHLVTGRIHAIRTSRHSIWLDLEGPLVVRVDRRDLDNFDREFPDNLQGRTVEVRGWLKPDRSGLRVNVRHPAALVVTDD